MPTYRVTRVVSVGQAETQEEAHEIAQAAVDAEGGQVTISCDDGSAQEHVAATEPEVKAIAERLEPKGAKRK